VTVRVETEAAGAGASGRPRKTRADGLRNRQRVIEAAKLAFTEIGPLVSLDTIARRAGVGIGTLYRHFPTRDALVEAVFRRELEQMAAAAKQLLATRTPGEALHEWMRLYVGFIATNKVLASAVSAIFGISAAVYRSSVAQITDSPVLGAETELYRSATTLFTEAATLLLDRAAAVGDIRAGVEPRDLLRGLAGFTATYGEDVEGWEASALRLVDILMDGLRARPPA
jgi:AcrR family transcriptional regulator